MDVAIWILVVAPTAFALLLGHWHLQVNVGRRLADEPLAHWRSLSHRERFALRWTVRNGRPVGDESLAELATRVSVIERELIDTPRARLYAALVGAGFSFLGVAALANGDEPPAVMLFLLAAFYFWGWACLPAQIRNLGDAAHANARLGAQRT